MQRNILLANSDYATLGLLAEIVRQLDDKWEVSRATSGWQVLCLLQLCPEQSYPSMLLLDETLRDMTAAQLLIYLARHSRYDSIPRYVLTTTAEHDKGRSFLPQNIIYLKRPAKPSEYKVLLARILGQVPSGRMR